MIQPTINKLMIEATTRCNGKCFFCSRHLAINANPEYMNKDDLNPELFNLIDLKKIDFISFCGIVGDVSLYKYLEQAIEIIRKQNSKCVIELFTNGFAHDNKWWYSIGKQMEYNKYNRTIFCLDGLEESHYKYRGTNFYTVLDHLESFAKTGSWTQVQCLLFKHNQKEISELRKIVKDKGAKVFFTRFSRYYDNDNFQPPTYAPYEDNVYKWSLSFNKTREPTCMLLSSNILFIDVEGNAFPCCHYAGEIISRQPVSSEMIKRLKSFLQSKDDINLFKRSIPEIFESKLFKLALGNYKESMFCRNKCNITRNDFLTFFDEEFPDEEKRICKGC